MCNKFDNQVNGNKEFEANLIISKRKTPNEFDFMHLNFKEKDDLYVTDYLNSSSISLLSIEKNFVISINSFLINGKYKE